MDFFLHNFFPSWPFQLGHFFLYKMYSSKQTELQLSEQFVNIVRDYTPLYHYKASGLLQSFTPLHYYRYETHAKQWFCMYIYISFWFACIKVYSCRMQNSTIHLVALLPPRCCYTHSCVLCAAWVLWIRKNSIIQYICLLAFLGIQNITQSCSPWKICFLGESMAPLHHCCCCCYVHAASYWMQVSYLE